VVLDFRNVTRGEQIAGLAGVALFVIMVAFKWYGLKYDSPTGTAERGIGTQEAATDNAFQAFTVIDLVLLLTVLAAVALPLWAALGRPAVGPIRPRAIVAALGGLAFVLIAFRLISPPDLEIVIPGGESLDVSDFPDPNPYEVTREVGPWLGLTTAALIACGGYLSARDRSGLDPGPASR
jgi:hypothetical protein